MIYNEKYVHFDWKDFLENKKCIFADDIDTLKNLVETKKTGSAIPYSFYIGSCRSHFKSIGELKDGKPFYKAETCASFMFCYYDPLYDIKWAYYNENKTIEFRSKDGSKWNELSTPGDCRVDWDLDGWEYRIKPSSLTVGGLIERLMQLDPTLPVKIDGKEIQKIVKIDNTYVEFRETRD